MRAEVTACPRRPASHRPATSPPPARARPRVPANPVSSNSSRTAAAGTVSPAVHAAARREPPALPVRIPRAEQQHPPLRVGQQNPRGRPPYGGWAHNADVTRPAVPRPAIAPGNPTGGPDARQLMGEPAASDREEGGPSPGERRASQPAQPALRLPVRVRVPGRPPERRQVHPDQRPRRRQGRDHEQPAADHPAGDPRHRAPAGRAAGHRGHARPAPAAHAARRAARQPGALHAHRGRRDRLLRPRGRPGRPRRQVPGQRAGRASRTPRSSRSSPRPTRCRRSGSPSSCSRSASWASGRTWCRCPRWPGSSSTCSPTSSSAPARGPAAVPGRRADRRARADHGGRADPRGGPGGRPGRAAALDRRGRRGDGAAGGPAGPHRRARRALRRAARARRRSSSAPRAPG